MNWFHFALGAVLMMLQGAVKNPESVAAEKRVLLGIRDLINQIYPGES